MVRKRKIRFDTLVLADGSQLWCVSSSYFYLQFQCSNIKSNITLTAILSAMGSRFE